MRVRKVEEIDADADGDQSLKSDLFASRQTKGTAPDNLDVVVCETHSTKGDRCEHYQPNVSGAEIGP